MLVLVGLSGIRLLVLSVINEYSTGSLWDNYNELREVILPKRK
jgi:hypothetical protein